MSASNPTCEYDQDGDAWITVIVGNEQPTALLEISKIVEEKYENTGFTYLAEDIDYSKIKYRITAAEDIIDYADGSLYYKKGDEVGIYSIGSNGKVEVPLPMGSFLIQEVSTLEGYVLDETVHRVDFIKQDDVKKLYTYTLNETNLMTTTEISKLDIDNNYINNCVLELYELGANNERKLVDTWKTTGEKHTIKGLKVNKIYILKEKSSAKEYVISSDIDFKIKNTTNTHIVDMVDKQVQVSKQDIAGEEIVGAKLQVIDRDNNVVDEWISTKTPHYVSGLKENEFYTLREEIAVDEYVKATDIPFKVSKDKETQKVVMIDKIVEMLKTDISGEVLEGAELKVFDLDGNVVDEWTSSKTPHRISGLVEGNTYILHEEYAPENYTIASDVEFVVSKDKQTQKVEMIDKIVEMSKKNFAGEELEGATIVVTNMKTKNIVDKWVSDKTPHKIKGLVEGESYLMHEEICIDGYVKATSIEFTVTTDKETQKVEMIDKIVEIIKTDLVTGEELEGAELIVTDEDGNIVDQWISTKEAHHVSNLEENKVYVLTEITCPYRI